MSKFLETNAIAIEALSKGNELTAQNLFRENVKYKPCCLTLNNLGVYYIQYGMTLKNGHIRSAKKVGLDYLLKASLYETDWRNCASIATALVEFGDLEYAYQYLLKADKLNVNHDILYNIGVCLFRLGRFQESSSVFESLCQGSCIDQIIQDGGQHPFLILAYCQIKLNNKKKCIKYIQKYRACFETDERLDVFHLRYLCGLHEEALSECFELLEEWYLTRFLLAMIIDCVSKFPSYTSTIKKTIPSEYNSLWNTLCKDYSLRMKEIEEYAYLPPLISVYHFIV